jgi:hypothetical protein
MTIDTSADYPTEVFDLPRKRWSVADIRSVEVEPSTGEL